MSGTSSNDQELRKRVSDNSNPTTPTKQNEKPNSTRNLKSKQNEDDFLDYFLYFLAVAIVVALSVSIYVFFAYGLETNNPSNAQKSRYQRKTNDKTVQFLIKLEDVDQGIQYELSLDSQLVCPHCDGSGADHPDDVVQCPACNGNGVRDVIYQMGGMRMQSQERCRQCGGTGHRINHKCHLCNGNRVTRGKKHLTLIVPQGVHEDHRVVFPGMSDEVPMYDTGDLIVTLKTEKHQWLTRSGHYDLNTTLTISLREALMGFTKDVKHLNGKSFSVSKDVITSHDDVITVEGGGLPFYDHPSKRGNLHVKISVKFPEKLTNEQKKEITKLFGK